MRELTLEGSQYPVSIVNWLTRGLGGVINLLHRLVDDGIPVKPKQVAALREVLTDLQVIIDTLAERQR